MGAIEVLDIISKQGDRVLVLQGDMADACDSASVARNRIKAAMPSLELLNQAIFKLKEQSSVNLKTWEKDKGVHPLKHLYLSMKALTDLAEEIFEKHNKPNKS